MGGYRNRTHRLCSFGSSTAHPEQCSIHIVWPIKHIQSTGWDSCPYFLLWQTIVDQFLDYYSGCDKSEEGHVPMCIK